MKKTLLIPVIAMGLAMIAPSAFAACPTTTPVKDTASVDGLGAVCPDGTQVAGFIYAATAPTTVNTGAADVICESVGADGCLTGGGTGDGVNIEGDWATTVTGGYLGCFTSLANPRLIAVVQAPDGSGFLASMSGLDVGFGYDFIVAHKIDSATFEVFPFVCGTGAGQPHIVSASAAGGSVTVSLLFDKPVVSSDCDADSYGKALAGFGFPDSCAIPYDFTPAVAGIYTRVQLCGTTPTIDTAQWTKSTATPAADGSASLTVPQPTNLADCATTNSCNCLFVGDTLTIGGQESGAITGYVQVAGDLAASPQALAVRATQAGGKVIVSFNTSTEIGLGKINILTIDKQGTRQVASTSPKGIGGAGASYELSVGRGDIKGGKSIVVELVSATGQSLFKSAPVGF
jgi:hypothetical protein